MVAYFGRIICAEEYSILKNMCTIGEHQNLLDRCDHRSMKVWNVFPGGKGSSYSTKSGRETGNYVCSSCRNVSKTLWNKRKILLWPFWHSHWPVKEEELENNHCWNLLLVLSSYSPHYRKKLSTSCRNIFSESLSDLQFKCKWYWYYYSGIMI